MKNILLNSWLETSVIKNGDLSLADIKYDKNAGDMVESTIAAYADKLNPLSDMVNLLVKRTAFHKQISSVDELTKLTTEIASYYADESKELNDKRSW